MSTRCNVHFNACGTTCANIYVHSDGYPDGPHGIPERISRFYQELESQTKDTRYSDPEYLAAKFLVWQASQYARNEKAPLGFLSVAPCVEDHGDIEYVYTVDCETLDQSGRPTVTWKKV